MMYQYKFIYVLKHFGMANIKKNIRMLVYVRALYNNCFIIPTRAQY